ncbi:NAD-dependent epimerase/dehydratase family protein [Macrococcoides caseolyticum]|uniref:NmrA family NAD(P)-binding protein n=1 Tax=Macrococcoides caseolyticum TaxID=69966 RepID=UPI0024BC2C95|nr:NAD-dependent epimerase/dehydratase family protein [Macrococcus caseolyticus]MDJ1088754.1 NAD-dependent epimerase/dehydratase family protein [Macrococcus caseolyticus]
MRLLITGATGHTGNFFLEQLNNNPKNVNEIICTVRETTNTDNLKKFNNLNIKTVVGNLKDDHYINEITKDIDVIINIANIRFSEILAKYGKMNNVKWLIGIHTTGRYSKFKSASAEYISIEDNLLKNKDLDLTILRPTMIYGSTKDHNMSKLIKFLDKTPVFPIFGDGKNLLQPVRAQDLGKAIYDVLFSYEKCKNKEYNLSGKNEIEYIDILKIISNQLNKRIIFIKLPIKLCYIIAVIGERFIPKFPIKAEQVLRMQEDKIYSHQEAKDDFEYNPLEFEQGIKDEVREYLNTK